MDLSYPAKIRDRKIARLLLGNQFQPVLISFFVPSSAHDSSPRPSFLEIIPE